MSTKTGTASPPAHQSPAHQSPAHQSPAYPERESRALKLWVSLSRANAAVAVLSEADIGRHGLTGGEFGILELIYHKGPMFLSDVQRRVLVSSGGVTYLVDRLEERGLLERKLCASDRRARYAALTRKGRALLKEIFPAHAAAMSAAMSGLTADEQKQAQALLKKLGLAAQARR